MKIFTFLAFLAPLIINAQYNGNLHPFAFQGGLYHSNPLSFEHKMLQEMKGQSVKEVKKTTTVGKKNYSSIYTFNSEGKPVVVTRGDKYKAELSYLNDTLISNVTITDKKTQTTDFKYVDGKLVLQESFVEDKLKTRSVNQYDENGNLLYSSLKNGRRGDDLSMLYAYEDNKKVEQRYMRNNKVVRVWNYTCDPKGEDVAAKVKSTVCKFKEEHEDGSYIEYSREEKEGDVFLFKKHFDADQKLLKTERYLNDSILLSESYEEGGVHFYTRYTKKGKVDYKSETTYDDDRHITRVMHQWKGKERRTTIVDYKYNDNGTLAEERYIHKEKVTRVTTYDYVM